MKTNKEIIKAHAHKYLTHFYKDTTVIVEEFASSLLSKLNKLDRENLKKIFEYCDILRYKGTSVIREEIKEYVDQILSLIQ